jgi:hypothetical protein
LLDDLHDAYMPDSPPPQEEPEPTTKAFYDMMAVAKRHLYEGANIPQLDAISQALANKVQYGNT